MNAKSGKAQTYQKLSALFFFCASFVSFAAVFLTDFDRERRKAENKNHER